MTGPCVLATPMKDLVLPVQTWLHGLCYEMDALDFVASELL